MLSSLIFVLSGAALGVARPGQNVENTKRQSGSCGTYEPAAAVKAPKTNPWAQITPADNAAIWDLLHDPATGLNLTLPSFTTEQTDNYVAFIDTLHTNKSAVLPYVDGNGPQPPKYARVVIFEGGKKVPVSQEYMVGPLPVSSNTTIQKLDYIFNGGKGGTVPFNARFFDVSRDAASEPLLASVMTEVADITQKLFGGAYYGAEDERTDLTFTFDTPVSLDGSQAVRIVMFRYPSEVEFLQPLDFYVILDIPGTDPSKYTLRGIVTNEKFFPTVAKFREAFEAGQIVNEFPQPRDAEWAQLTRKKEMGTRTLEDRLAPQSIELGGKRYKLDAEQNYVEYMGWSFYMSWTRQLGLAIYDIKFKGERIIYELSLQEAAAQYAGNTPKAASTVYHDTHYGFGAQSAVLLEGFDCPFGATMLNVSYPEGRATTVKPQAVCIFEADSGFPLARHRTGGFEPSDGYGFSNLGVVKASALHVRHVATVGNYDYLFDFAFNVDGSLEVSVRASGYLQASPYYKTQGRFGPRIHNSTQGSYHDHVVTFKADFDILDTKNSFQVTSLQTVQQSQPWFPELGSFDQMELHASNLKTESQLNFDPNGQSMYTVTSDKTNAWGEKRGYRIVPGHSNIHLTSSNSPFSRKQSEMSKSHLAVTRVKDTEPYANSWQNVNLPQAPQQDFSKFFDGESIENEDLTVWFNLGMHHFTRSEDIPVTLFTEASSSILFAPQNFFDRAQEGDLQNRRWVETGENMDELSWETYGVPLAGCDVRLREPVSGILPWESVEG
ncbi:copper amine oxidase [Cercophora newfieldiana]|uniref:Amine oxidase n=1 Tax=Cercophora newfieldiana TaxID=92897 RepID=A0AA39Y9V9_9PEZI|nr:copper amine oxidase [Cercophora newfieldiana]